MESARARLSDPAGSVGANLPISVQIGYSSSYHLGRARGSHLTSAIWQGTLCPKKEVKMILKEPHARAA